MLSRMVERYCRTDDLDRYERFRKNVRGHEPVCSCCVKENRSAIVSIPSTIEQSSL